MSQKWDIEITPNSKAFDFKLDEVWSYRDLLTLFVRRDFVSHYKQTILGPMWYFIQPILTTLTFTIIFGNVAKISTNGVPHFAFYMAGITLWQYFADCLNTTATTFTTNQQLFGKVYFPRLIVPLSVVTAGLIKLSIQFLLFLLIVGYYFNKGMIQPNVYALLTPLLIFMLAFTALGGGMIFSSLTTKYRDLVFLLVFGIQLFMYATPVIYPSTAIPEKYQTLAAMNPLSHIIEAFRYGFLGVGNLSFYGLLYSFCFTIGLFFLGLAIFNKVERSFMDSV